MAATYKTLDYIDDLRSSDISKAIQIDFVKKDVNPNWKDHINDDNVFHYMALTAEKNDADFPKWDLSASNSPVQTHWLSLSTNITKFNATESLSYDIFSASYFTPYAIKIYDSSGNAIALGTNKVTLFNDFGAIKINDFIAPYSGLYYIDAGWHQGSGIGYEMVSLDIYADTDVRKILLGTNSNDSITGTDGNDTLDGGLGKDTLTGRKGDDTYIFDNNGDKIIEDLDAGTDTVQSSTTYTLGNNLENLELLGVSKINETGNALDNALLGNNGNNILNGMVGNDVLSGGKGSDKLTGGTDADIFKYTSVDDSGITAKTRDTITDFKHSEGDKIDLSGLGFNFIGTQAFSTTDATGELRFDAKTHILSGSTNSDNKPEFSILLSDVKTLVADDLIITQ